eukprot:92034_1
MAAQKDDQKTNVQAVQRDKTEVKFFEDHPEIASLEEQMRTKNAVHPLYDLKSSEQETWCVELATLVLKCNLVDTSKLEESLSRLYEFEYHCFKNIAKRGTPEIDYGLLFFLGINMARSRLNMLLLQAKKVKCQLSVLVPMYGEQNRMQSSEVHPNGEDFIRRKVKQLDWLYRDINADEMDWNLIFVDDGCPNDSGTKANQLIASDNDVFSDEIKEKISIEFLKDGLDIFQALKSTNDSRKGGAVQYGMHLALRQEISNDKQHFIMYTDSDLSTNISQSGLLLAPITVGNANNTRKAVIGDRYSKGIFSNGTVWGIFRSQSVALKLRALFRGELLPPLKKCADSQCGFKLFSRECIERVLPKLTEYQGMFDMELLLKSFDEFYNYDDQKQDASDDIIYPEGVVWLNSIDETVFNANAPLTADFTQAYGKKHYNQLQEVISIHNGNYKDNQLCSEEWVKFIVGLEWDTYFRLCLNIFNKGINGFEWEPSFDDIKAMCLEKEEQQANDAK